MRKDLISIEPIAKKIFDLRGQKVLFDYDLALLYGIETRALKQAVRRNLERFPSDFMFELSAKETKEVVSQFVIPSRRSGERTRPACWRWRPRRRELFPRSIQAFGTDAAGAFSARRQKEHARRVWSAVTAR
jgi:hypothetical protein